MYRYAYSYAPYIYDYRVLNYSICLEPIYSDLCVWLLNIYFVMRSEKRFQSLKLLFGKSTREKKNNENRTDRTNRTAAN